MAPIIPKLAVPLTMTANGFRTVEQDSHDEIQACVYALVATPLGARIELPEYGVEDPTFEQLPMDLHEVIEQAGEYERRADLQTAQDVEEQLIEIGVKQG